MTLEQKFEELMKTVPPDCPPQFQRLIKLWFYSGIHAFVSEFVGSVHDLGNGLQGVDMMRVWPLIDESMSVFEKTLRDLGLGEEAEVDSIREMVESKIKPTREASPPPFFSRPKGKEIH